MKVVDIKVANFRGVTYLHMQPGVVTVVKGPNGIGKTSLLTALRSIADVGDEEDIRTGASERRVEFTLEDGTSLVRRQAVGKKPELTVSLPDYGTVSKAQTFVDTLFDRVGIDPWDLINAPDNKRAEYLQDLLTVDLPDAEALAVIPDLPGVQMPRLRENLALKLNPKMGGVEKLEALRDQIFTMRTEQNAIARDKKASVAELRKTLPPEAGMPEKPLSEMRGELEQLDGQVNRELQMAVAARDEAKENARAERATAKETAYAARKAEDAAINADIDARIKLLENERHEKLMVVNETWRKAETEATVACSLTEAVATETCSNEEARIRASVDARRKVLVEEIARMEEVERTAVGASATRGIADKHEKEGLAAEQRSKGLTEAITKLDEKKSALLDKIPVKGLEIRKKLVYLDGHPFTKANTARQIEAAVEVAALRAGKSGLIIVDHGEALDAESFQLLTEIAEKKGLQVIVGVVGEGQELSVESHDVTADEPEGDQP